MRALGGTCALVSVLLMAAACGGAGGDPTTSSEPGRLRPTASPGPTGPEVRPLPPQDHEYVTLKRARYALPLPPSLVTAVDVPNAWSVHQGRFLSSWPQSHDHGELFVLAAPEDSTAVPANPCRDHERYTVVGPTERDLAVALSRQKFLHVSSPVRVVIGGREGVFVRLRVPRAAEITDCADHAVDLYTLRAPEDAWQVGGAGTVVRLWILDIDGERHIVQTISEPEATRRDAAVLRRMVESITFERVDDAVGGG